MLEAILKLPERELAARIEEKEREIRQVESESKRAFQTMQTKYDELAAEHQMTKARIKDKIRMLKAVQEGKGTKVMD
jgi:thymidylate kinase